MLALTYLLPCPTLRRSLHRFGWLVFFTTCAVISGCSDSSDSSGKTDAAQAAIRGLKTVVVGATESTTTRQYASVLQPAEVTTLSFQLSGKVTDVKLRVGQAVEKGQLLASLESESLALQVANAQAALRQAQASARNATADFRRKSALKDDGMITAAQLDEARALASSGESSVQQAQTQLDSAKNDLEKSRLLSPIDGIISAVNLEAFSTVSAGAPVLDIYSDKALEASFSVSYTAVNQISIGQPVTVIPSDSPDIKLRGIVTELASRADRVSSFPVVITLQESLPTLRAGMAAAVLVDYKLPQGSGYSLPLSVVSRKEHVAFPANPVDPISASVFVYQREDSSVQQRDVQISGVSGNNIVIVDGIAAGEVIAVAGVSFLRDGQKVKLLDQSGMQ